RRYGARSRRCLQACRRPRLALRPWRRWLILALLLVEPLFQLVHPLRGQLTVLGIGIAAADDLVAEIGRARVAGAAGEVGAHRVAVGLLLVDREQLALQELVLLGGQFGIR